MVEGYLHVEQGAQQRVERENILEEDEFWDYDKQVDIEGGLKSTSSNMDR